MESGVKVCFVIECHKDRIFREGHSLRWYWRGYDRLFAVDRLVG